MTLLMIRVTGSDHQKCSRSSTSGVSVCATARITAAAAAAAVCTCTALVIDRIAGGGVMRVKVKLWSPPPTLGLRASCLPLTTVTKQRSLPTFTNNPRNPRLATPFIIHSTARFWDFAVDDFVLRWRYDPSWKTSAFHSFFYHRLIHLNSDRSFH